MSRYEIIEVKETECKQAILFARISSKKQDDGVSKEAQMSAMRAYCHKQGFKIIKEYSIVESSTIGNRPKFREMINFLKSQKEKTALVVHSVDRLQRDFAETAIFRKLAQEGIIEVHFLRENFNLDQDFEQSEEMQYDLNVFGAKMYVSALRAHVRKAINYNLNNGIFPARAPLGYLNYRDENDKANIKIDEERAPKIKRLFLEYATGLHSAASLWEIAKEMNLKTRATKKLPSHLISPNKIIDILNNPFYSGIMVVKGKAYPHNYERIITPELFKKVKDILDNKGKKKKNVQHQQIYGKQAFTFRGLIKCGSCGCSMTSEEHIKPSGKIYHYLRCSHMKGECHQKPVSESKVFEQLDKELFSRLQIPKDILILLQKNVKMRLEEDSKISAAIKRDNTTKLEELKGRKKRLFNAFIDKEITNEEYQEAKTEMETEISELEAKNQKYVAITSEIKDAVERIVEIVGNISDIMKATDPAIQNQLLNLLIENCILEDGQLKYNIRPPFSAFMKVDAENEIPNYITGHLDEFNQIAYPVGLLSNYLPLEAA